MKKILIAILMMAPLSLCAQKFAHFNTADIIPNMKEYTDAQAEIQKMEAELKHLEGFLMGVKKKLSNERFVANAPAQVVELERKKQSDAETKIAALKESINALKAR